MLLIQAIINGIFIGSVYGLIALGLTLIFGVMKIINFAHGSFLMIGMFATFFFTTLTGINPYFSIILVCPLLFFLGFITQHFLLKSVLIAEHDIREPISVLLLTSGLWIFLDNLFLVFFGPDYHALPAPFSKLNWFFADTLLINKARFCAFIASWASAIGLYLFLQRSELGRSLKAVGQDRQMAGLLGIDVYKTYNIAFGIACAIVGIAGAVLVPFYYVHPNVGILFGIKAFIIVVLGGLGSISGALLGGVIVGLVESFGGQFISATMTEGLIYIIFLSVLFFRPSGLFGLKQDW